MICDLILCKWQRKSEKCISWSNGGATSAHLSNFFVAFGVRPCGRPELALDSIFLGCYQLDISSQISQHSHFQEDFSRAEDVSAVPHESCYPPAFSKSKDPITISNAWPNDCSWIWFWWTSVRSRYCVLDTSQVLGVRLTNGFRTNT